MIAQETQELIDSLTQRWDEIKKKTIKKEGSYGSEFDSTIGHIWWDNPLALWVYVSDNEEDYEGSQEQIAVTKEGKLVWEYQSHCSCNGYEDSHGHSEDFLEELKRDPKRWQLKELTPTWESEIRINIIKLLDL